MNISVLKKFLLPLHFSTSILGFAGVTVVKALGGLIIVKLMATDLGPNALGQLGQLMTMVGIIGTLAGGGITNALIQSLAGASNAHERQQRLTAALKIYIALAICISLLLIFTSNQLSVELLNREDMGWIFILLAATQWLVGANNLLQAVFSALHRVRTIVLINGLGTIAGTIIFVLLVWHASFQGAALALVLYPTTVALTGCIVAIISLPRDWLRPVWNTTYSDTKHLLSYSLVMLVAVTALPLAQIAVRDMVGNGFGWQYVGYWQGMLKLSDVYMQFVGMLLIYYALPRFSAQSTQASRDHELQAFQLPMVILMAIGLTCVFLIRDIIIQLLFSHDFYPMRSYFLPQIFGDLMRIMAQTYVYYAISRGARLIPILFEIVQAAGLLALCHVLLNVYGEMTPVYGYMIASAISLLAMLILHKRFMYQHDNIPDPKIQAEIVLAGLASE